ncbi:MAG: hypothetical protein Q4F97_03980 [Bacteroidales bacterium]|nr:hypothetical protein [Bacteroidales bacterium]
MLETVIFTGVIVALSFALLAIKIIFVKNGKFPNTHLSGNPSLRKKGIGCAKQMDREAQSNKHLFDLIND